MAARAGHEGSLDVLLSHGADIEAVDSEGTTALMVAAVSDRAACVKELLSKGASVLAAGKCGKTALHLAACHGPSCLPALLAAGSHKEAADIDGCTPLMWAAVWPRLASVAALLEAGSRTEASDCSGRTALLLAAGASWWWQPREEQQYVQCVQLLLQHSANSRGTVAAVDSKGCTALHWAAKRGSISIIDALAAATADLAARSKMGNTARQVAGQAGEMGAAQRLLELELEHADAEAAEAAAAAGQGAAAEAVAAEAGAAAAAAAVAEAAGAGPAAAAGAAAAGLVPLEEAAAAAAAAPGPAAAGVAAAELDLDGLVGRRISVWWDEEREWVPGTVLLVSRDRVYLVEHEGVGQKKQLQRVRLQHERFQVLGPDGQVEAQYRNGRRVLPAEVQQGAPAATGGASERQGRGAAGAPVVQQQPTRSRGSGERTEPAGAVGGALAAGPAAPVPAPATSSGRRQRAEQQPQPERPCGRQRLGAAEAGLGEGDAGGEVAIKQEPAVGIKQEQQEG